MKKTLAAFTAALLLSTAATSSFAAPRTLVELLRGETSSHDRDGGREAGESDDRGGRESGERENHNSGDSDRGGDDGDHGGGDSDHGGGDSDHGGDDD